MEKIYICGQVSGLHHDRVYHKFASWEYNLNKLGFEVVNPMKLISRHTKYAEMMRTRIHALTECNSIFILDDWKESQDSRLEYDLALKLRLSDYNTDTIGELFKKSNRYEIKAI